MSEKPKNNIWAVIKERCRIKTGVGWAIFWGIILLIVFVVVLLLSDLREWLNAWMLRYSSPYISYRYAPREYAYLMIVVLIMIPIVEAVLFLCGKSDNVKLLAPLIGGVVILLLFPAYLLHCNLLVSKIWKEEPYSIYIDPSEDREVKINTVLSWQMTEEELARLVELCQGLTIASEEKQLQGEEWYSGINQLDYDYISLTYSNGVGWVYSYSFYLYEEHIFIWRGYNEQNQQMLTFLEDDGLLEYLEEIKEKYPTSSRQK